MIVNSGDAVATRLTAHVPAPLRILLVDRSSDITEQYGVLLGHLGHHSSAACDGASALALVAAMPFDVVISGLKLLDMDGYALAARLRAHPNTSGARLIAVSGASGKTIGDLARQAGFDEYYCKPASVDQIVGLLTAQSHPLKVA